MQRPVTETYTPIESREEPNSMKEVEERPSTAKERRNIFNAGDDSEYNYNTNRNLDELANDDELFNDLQ